MRLEIGLFHTASRALIYAKKSQPRGDPVAGVWFQVIGGALAKYVLLNIDRSAAPGWGTHSSGELRRRMFIKNRPRGMNTPVGRIL